MNNLSAFVTAAFYIVYFVVGLFAFFAIWAGVEHAFGFNSFFVFCTAAILAYVPVVGIGLGIWGAITVWSWPWYWAVALYFGPFVFVSLLSAINALLESNQPSVVENRQNGTQSD